MVTETKGGTGALDTAKHQRLDATLDKLRARYGRKVVYFGSVQESRDDAPMRIAFFKRERVSLRQPIVPVWTHSRVSPHMT